MKAKSLCLAACLCLAAVAVWAADTDRWHGGSYDGWDLRDMTNYGGLGATVSVSLSSVSNQVFDWTQASAALAAVTITATEPAGTITNGGTMRISVPAAWPCRFDTGATVSYGGGAAGKAGAASFSGDGRTLQIPVTSDFVALDTLTVSGLRLADLRLAPAGTGQLGLDFTGTTAPDVYDTYTVAVRVQWAGGGYDGWDCYTMAESAELKAAAQGTVIAIR
jgi:hypothetical protein